MKDGPGIGNLDAVEGRRRPAFSSAPPSGATAQASSASSSLGVTTEVGPNGSSVVSLHRSHAWATETTQAQRTAAESAVVTARLRSPAGRGSARMRGLPIIPVRRCLVPAPASVRVTLPSAGLRERARRGRRDEDRERRRAVEILREARLLSGGAGLAFPSQRGKALADRALSMLVRDQGIAAVSHGFRSSFRDWAAERTNHPREVVEAALAHVVGNKVEAAYVGDHEKVSVSDAWSSGVILGLLTAGCRVNGYGTCVGGCAAAG